MAIFINRHPTRPQMEMMVSRADQDLMVSMMVRLKYSLNSQKPGSLTWEKITLPEPTAITISSGLAPVVAMSGAAIPPAVMAATVAEPRAIRSTAAMAQASSSGDMLLPTMS